MFTDNFVISCEIREQNKFKYLGSRYSAQER